MLNKITQDDERTPVTSTGELSIYLGTENEPVLEHNFCSSVSRDQLASSLITRSWYSTVSSESVIPSGLLWYSTVSLLSSLGTGTLTGCSSASLSIGKMGVPVLGPASRSSLLSGLLLLEHHPPNGCETKNRREQSFDSQEQELWPSSEERRQEQ